jgi:hypothetical protein
VLVVSEVEKEVIVFKKREPRGGAVIKRELVGSRAVIGLGPLSMG